jgi:metal-sulfur cluster biosynthetic enzyme
VTLVQLERRAARGAESASLEQGMNFAAVLAESRGEAHPLPAPPAWESPPADLAERAHRALYEVSDPEFPISLVDLGLIYDVAADESTGGVTVSLTFTATACPCTDFIKWDVRERLLAEPGIDTVEIEVVWDPPWSTARVTERGRGILERAGIALIT